MKCQVAEGKQSLKDITMELAVATLVGRFYDVPWAGQGIATELPQIRFHKMPQCLKYDTLTATGENVTCLKTFHIVPSRIAFLGHDRSTQQRWKGAGSIAGSHKIQKNNLVDSVHMSSDYHPWISLDFDHSFGWTSDTGGLWCDPHSRRSH